MARIFKILNRHSQVQALGSNIKYRILDELTKQEATCQQLANTLNMTKQNIHYNLKQLQKKELIEVAEEYSDSDKEVFYRSSAKNFVLDFSLGKHIPPKMIFSREMVDSVLKSEYNIELVSIADKLINESLKIKGGERLFIISGQYNMPLAEKIVNKASSYSIKTTMHYQGLDMCDVINNQLSLSSVKCYYDNLYNAMAESDVVLILNGESSVVKYSTNAMKRDIQYQHRLKIYDLVKSRKELGFRLALMLGFSLENLSEENFQAELRFWKSIDIDYDKLFKDTLDVVNRLTLEKKYQISTANTKISFVVERLFSDYGSYNDSAYNSPIINLPGGEVLIVPQEGSLNGVVNSPIGYVMGTWVENIRICLQNGEIVEYLSESNQDCIAKAIDYGGADGRKVALICVGTNTFLDLETVNQTYRHKTRGVISLYWGNNTLFNGNVKGCVDWFVELYNTKLELC
jgi:leucyl aminopeptidase (aminopeptidase T)